MSLKFSFKYFAEHKKSWFITTKMNEVQIMNSISSYTETKKKICISFFFELVNSWHCFNRVCLISLIKETLYLCHRNLMHLPIRKSLGLCVCKLFIGKIFILQISVAESLLHLCFNQIIVWYFRVWEYETMQCDILIEAQAGVI